MYTRIKDLREDKDIKQTVIAKYLGIKQNSYSQIENGKNNLQIEHIIKLSEFYNTSVDYLLGLTDIMKPYPRKNIQNQGFVTM